VHNHFSTSRRECYHKLAKLGSYRQLQKGLRAGSIHDIIKSHDLYSI
jgi:hypothetical protein